MPSSYDLRRQLEFSLGHSYTIESELSGGGMARVFLATERALGRRVVIKVLASDVAADVSTKRFEREVRLAASLQQANIVPVLSAGNIAGVLHYTMPFVEGLSLRARLQQKGRPTLTETVGILRDVARALAYAHEHGVVHRDIKPENVLLSGGAAVVTDFGIAKAIASARLPTRETAAVEITVTQLGTAVGTPAYMAPEQVSADPRIDHRADLYSFGCLAYELLAGTPPFEARSMHALFAAHLSERPVPLGEKNADTPPPLAAVVMRCLEKDPDLRPQSARDILRTLEGVTAGASRVAKAWQSLSRKQRWWVAGAASAALVAGAVWLLFVLGTYGVVAGARWRADDTKHARFTQLTSQPGIEWFPSLSPDGKWVVYSGEQSGNRDIYLQSVGGETAINLTKDSPAADDQPAFSPDGERIAFRSGRDGGGVFVMGRTGEGLRRVTDRGFRPAWSPDGKRLAFVHENVEINPGNFEVVSALWVVDVAGGEPRRLSALDAVMPAWSPNGHRIAFMSRTGAPSVGDVLTIPANGGNAVPVTNDVHRDWSPAWSADGRYLYFSSDRSGSMNLWRVRIDEESGQTRGPPEQVTTPTTYLAHPATSTVGGNVAYTSALITINVQRLGFDPVKGIFVGEPTWVTTGTRRWSSPDPSPDGEWVAFYSLAQPEGHLYVSRSDGTGLRRLTGDSAVADRVPRWSPDGQWIAYFSNRARSFHLWKIRADGSGLQRLTPRIGAYASWSPDGRRVATSGGANLGDSVRLYTIGVDAPFEAQRPDVAPPSALGRFYANSWSADGTKLVGQLGQIGPEGTGLAVYSIADKKYERITDFGEWPVWLPDGRRFLFVADGNAFYVADVRSKEVRKVYSVRRDMIGPPRLTRDGRMAFFTHRVTEADIWLLSTNRD